MFWRFSKGIFIDTKSTSVVSEYTVRMSDLLNASDSSCSTESAPPDRNTKRVGSPTRTMLTMDSSTATQNTADEFDLSLGEYLSDIFSSPKSDSQTNNSPINVHFENSKNVKVSTYQLDDVSVHDNSKPVIDVKAKLTVTKSNIKLKISNISPRKSTLKRSSPVSKRCRTSLANVFKDNQQKSPSPISPIKHNSSQPINLPEPIAEKAAKSICLPPLMGISAMLHKQSDKLWNESQESEIIAQLVLEKFMDIMKRRRSFYKRYTRMSRKTIAKERNRSGDLLAQSSSIHGVPSECVEVETESERWVTTTDIKQELEEVQLNLSNQALKEVNPEIVPCIEKRSEENSEKWTPPKELLIPAMTVVHEAIKTSPMLHLV